jgi:hypothetical protein
MRYITVDEILEINRGTRGALDAQGLRTAGQRSHATQQSAFGEDAYPYIHLKADTLMHSLARNHACFYARNGWRLDLEQAKPSFWSSTPLKAAWTQTTSHLRSRAERPRSVAVFGPLRTSCRSRVTAAEDGDPKRRGRTSNAIVTT